MDIKLYLLPNRIGLKFAQATERDSFWSAMSDAGRAVSERIGNRTIRFLPQQMKDNQGLIIPLSGNGTVPVPVPVLPKPAPPAQANPGIVNVGAGGDPFALTGQNAHKALPGMVPVQSNMPPKMPQNSPQSDSGGISAQPTPENATAGQPEPQASIPEAKTAPKDDPEPADKRTKAYRTWWARNHGQANSPK